MNREAVKNLALECGFELAGVAAAEPLAEAGFYRTWVEHGMAGEMRYLADRRGEMRADPHTLLASARSIVCVGKLYNCPQPYSTSFSASELAWISRYAWGADYHDILRRGLERLEGKLRRRSHEPFESKICVDTAPLLERAYARRAGLGWIGKNTCLIHEGAGSWFFLGELLVSLPLEADSPPPDRCGTCSRCIDACPTDAIVPTGQPDLAWTVDARRCISYITIELRGIVPEDLREHMGHHVFGCDICQDVCPWNREAPVTADPCFAPRHFAPPLERLAALTEAEFRTMFRPTPIERARYRGFLRNVAVAMGNSANPALQAPLERLSRHSDELVRTHAAAALARLEADRIPPRAVI